MASIARALMAAGNPGNSPQVREFFRKQAMAALAKAVPEPQIGRPGTGAKLLAKHFSTATT